VVAAAAAVSGAAAKQDGSPRHASQATGRPAGQAREQAPGGQSIGGLFTGLNPTGHGALRSQENGHRFSANALGEISISAGAIERVDVNFTHERLEAFYAELGVAGKAVDDNGIADDADVGDEELLVDLLAHSAAPLGSFGDATGR
jgi:hypothetical protein